jgi:hypothetical protein
MGIIRLSKRNELETFRRRDASTAARLTNIESEASIEHRIAKDENPRPTSRFTASDPVSDKLGANASGPSGQSRSWTTD